MKKNKALAVVSIVAVLVLASFLLWPKVGIKSAKSVLAGQPLTLYFTSPGTVDASKFYVTDQQNKKVPAKMTYGNEKSSLKIGELPPGEYQVHLPLNSFGGWQRAANSTVSFAVIESVQPVTSVKEIEKFFAQVKKRNTFMGRDDVVMESASEDKATAQGNSNYSETNQQVAGVDEADIVKTDGDFIYDVTNYEELMITDIRNPKNMVNASVTNFGGQFYPRELYVDDDLLVVIGNRQSQSPDAMTSNRIMPMQELSVIRVYDVTNRKQPKLLREAGAEGYIIGTRKIDQHVYMITNNQPMYWMTDMPVEGEQYLPKVFDSTINRTSQPMELDKISILPGAMEPSYSVITAIDIRSAAEGSVQTKAYLGSGEQLYMSKDNIYLTSTQYDEGRSYMAGNSEVFKFALNGTSINFQQTAQLKGTILNQFSMDEHDGYFRVVTTEGNLWDEKNVAKNHLFILDSEMKQVGSVENLAVNERIYSARFIGDKAYMVTFRETDPLFVMDVGDPRNPKVLGELKIPGFSNYLHPLADGHLIGFGYETVAKKNPQGGEPIIQTRGMKISLFDVTDFANPKEQAFEIIGEQGTYSPVQHDHRALFIHPARNLFGFPITVYKEGKNGNYLHLEKVGAMIYEITAEKGITMKANLTDSITQDYMDWEREVQRLLYSGDAVYTIAAGEVNSYSLDGFRVLDVVEK
ncbi:beta-propeller domain-containing protein [Sporosarcina sp. GW1-11]|uniref:beta-propeller domain-containing protein n=1 Tax=Sporosarcina sp. GW1-11 TaxID=2899126 RepID=UPI00294DCFD5|nr:beta-propeller domain-containing protein [Sporosarcina sp. GW1-11]MDV6379331.1 beta-propeller domain-containing protein [Sporosarcina sp. GW1-11]